MPSTRCQRMFSDSKPTSNSASTRDKDARLLARLKSGDPDAVAAWHRQYYPKVLRIVQSKLPTQKDAEEVSQDVFLSCLKHLPLFRGESSIWTWMQRITSHEVADYYRKYYAKKTIHALSLDTQLLSRPVADAHETAELVKQALAKLSPEYQELLLLKYVDKKTVKAIASDLSRTVKAVESDLFRARQQFRDAYLVVVAASAPV